VLNTNLIINSLLFSVFKGDAKAPPKANETDRLGQKPKNINTN